MELEKADVHAEITGRAKKPYSIWRKMEEKNIPFSGSQTFTGFARFAKMRRIVIEHLASFISVGALFLAFKDYVSQPKSNGYRSIHHRIWPR